MVKSAKAGIQGNTFKQYFENFENRVNPILAYGKKYIISSLPDSPDLNARYTYGLEQSVSLYGGHVQVIFLFFSRFH